VIYLKKYYNGYGYNFYTGKYGYYETSPNGVKPVPTGGWIAPLMAISFVILVIACLILGMNINDMIK